MNFYARQQIHNRSKLRSEFLLDISQVNDNKQFEDDVGDFLKEFRKRQQFYAKLISYSKKDPYNSEYDDSQIKFDYDDMNIKLKLREANLRNYKTDMTNTQKKILVYHFCTKIIQVLDFIKEKVKKINERWFNQIQANKQHILRMYRSQIEKNEFDITELTYFIAHFPRKSQQTSCIFPKIGLKTEDLEETKQSSISRFVMSTQILSNKQKDHLNKFMELKQKQQKKKAIIEQKNANQLKILRKIGRKLYKIMQIDEILKEEFCMSMTKEVNTEAMYEKVMERNKVIQQQRKKYEETYKQNLQKSPGSDVSKEFRIKKFGQKNQRNGYLFSSGN